VPGAVLWRSRIGPGAEPGADPARRLPGPALGRPAPVRRRSGHDAPEFQRQPAEQYVALRFSGGSGRPCSASRPTSSTDSTVDLGRALARGAVRRLTEQVAADPVGRADRLAAGRLPARSGGPARGPGGRDGGRRVPVATMADRTGSAPGSCSGGACRCSATALGTWLGSCDCYGPWTPGGRAGRWPRWPPGRGTAIRRTAPGRSGRWSGPRRGGADALRRSGDRCRLKLGRPPTRAGTAFAGDQGDGGSAAKRSTGVPSGSCTTA
jgi:hypothetical protein